MECAVWEGRQPPVLERGFDTFIRIREQYVLSPEPTVFTR